MAMDVVNEETVLGNFDNFTMVQKALEMYAKSVELEPDNTYYIFVYGIALNSDGYSIEAIKILERGYQINPFNSNILHALSSISRDAGDDDKFHKYYGELVELKKQVN